jgi:tripartite-type tricarboxylate transporter receptor subunit TctC
MILPMQKDREDSVLNRNMLGGFALRVVVTTAVVNATTAFGLPAAASAQDFFAGKTVTLVVGYQAGSLYDTNARFVARHLARFIPGNPTVVVRNMPGAGTLTAANNVANLTPKDGTTIALIARGMSIEPLLGGQGVRFEPLTLNWIGSTSQVGSVFAVRSVTGVWTLDDGKARVVGGAGPAPGPGGVTFPTALDNLRGA